MILTDEIAKSRIKNPLNKEYLHDVRLYESQMRVFTEEMKESELISEPYWHELNNIIESRVKNKYKRVKQFFRFPLPVVSITDSVLNDFFKVFEGKNRFFNINADSDVSTLNEWIKNSNVEKWIETKAKKIFKNKPCTFVVVDKDKTGNPYLIEIDSARVIDAKVNYSGQCEYIIFNHSENRVAVYDSISYRVFLTNGEDYSLETKINHNLSKCPARLFISTNTNSHNPLKRRVAFGGVLSKLEDYTIFDVFLNYVDHYAPFPITEAPIQKCVNLECRGGKVIREQIIDKRIGGKTKVFETCPACKGKINEFDASPGLHIGIKLNPNKERVNGAGMFKMHFPETDKMKYIPEKLDSMELGIRYKTVGISSVLQSEAVNELQVKGSFASMESILIRTKKELDKLYQWIIEIVSESIYKKTKKISVEANFGTEFYLMSENELQERFENAKNIGLPISEQVLIYKQLIDTKYKGNNHKIQRQNLLIDLDPLPLYSEKESIELFKLGVIDEITLNLKINFYKYISKFELENTNISDFGSNLAITDKLNIILSTIKTYQNESK